MPSINLVYCRFDGAALLCVERRRQANLGAKKFSLHTRLLKRFAELRGQSKKLSKNKHTTGVGDCDWSAASHFQTQYSIKYTQRLLGGAHTEEYI
jgi:hypothetical protein